MKSALSGALACLVFPLPGIALAADTTSPGAGAAVQTLLALCVVIGVIAVIAWTARRAGAMPRGNSRLRLVSGVSVGTRERVVIVEAGDTWLVLGVAPGQVNALHTLPRPVDPGPRDEATAAPSAGFAELLGKLRNGRTGARDAG